MPPPDRVRALRSHFGAASVPAAAAAAPRRLALTAEQRRRFAEDGFVVIDGAFDPAELQPARDALTRWVSEIARGLMERGALRADYAELPFEQRLAAIEKEVPGIAARMHMDKARFTQWPEMQALWSDARFLDVCEQLIGPDVAFHPNFNVRLKVPSAGGPVDYHTVHWHQDAGYLSPESDTTMQVSVWLPLVDSNRRNGAMQFVRGGHRAKAGGVMRHRYKNDGTWYLFLEGGDYTRYLEGRDVVTCEVPVGSFILFNNTVPHRSIENTTKDIVRWSLDLRWQDPRLPAGMGPNTKLMHLRSAKPGFTPGWVPVVGGAVHQDEKGRYANRWPGAADMSDLQEVARRTKGVLRQASQALRTGR